MVFLVPVGRIHVSADRAGLTGVLRIHHDSHTVVFAGLVFDLQPQVIERPADLLIPLLQRHPFSCVSNSRQVLKDKECSFRSMGHE